MTMHDVLGVAGVVVMIFMLLPPSRESMCLGCDGSQREVRAAVIAEYARPEEGCKRITGKSRKKFETLR